MIQFILFILFIVVAYIISKIFFNSSIAAINQHNTFVIQNIELQRENQQLQKQLQYLQSIRYCGSSENHISPTKNGTMIIR